MFQPYTGVKTSILIFRKETRRDDKQNLTWQAPRSEHVWFYEIENDGFTLDAKRNARPGQANDLWDALVKFKTWLNEGRAGSESLEKTYLQPAFHTERWRQAQLRDSADQLTAAGHAFANQTDSGMWDGQVWGIHELFPEMPTDPKLAESKVISQQKVELHNLIVKRLAQNVGQEYFREGNRSKEASDKDWAKAIKDFEGDFKRVTKDIEKFFEKEDSPALTLWKELVKSVTVDKNLILEALGEYSNGATYSLLPPSPVSPAVTPKSPLTDSDWRIGLECVAREVAKLDGFDVVLRSLAIDQQTTIATAKHWVIPVRQWLTNGDWQSADGKLQGSHDAHGLVRPEYVRTMLDLGLYDDKDNLKDGLLDPDCIEARDWNLSAGQYKPFDFSQLKSDKSVVELIGELRDTEQKIMGGLDKLLAMVEGRE
ncbi:MAG: hypothetical protein PHH11_15675 [Methylomonas sp.]|nr:hypothetical protein [Methylomonas sp.]